MKKYLTSEENQRLFDVIDGDKSIFRYRNRAIFYLAKYCALSVGEIMLLDINDYEVEARSIHCGKVYRNSERKIIIYDEKVRNVLNEYYIIRCAMEIDSNLLFVSQRKTSISRQMFDCLMKTYCKQADISEEKQHFHVLKNTRARELLKLGFSINELQWWLGHKNIMTIFEYLSDGDDTEVDEKIIYEKIKKEVEQIE